MVQQVIINIGTVHIEKIEIDMRNHRPNLVKGLNEMVTDITNLGGATNVSQSVDVDKEEQDRLKFVKNMHKWCSA